MKKSLAILFAVLLFGCSKEDETKASIVGQWRGDYIDIRVNYGFIPVYTETDDDFDVILEFKEDGTVTFTRQKDGSVTTGTYAVNGNKLTTDVDFQLYETSGSTTFDIVELSQQRLRLRIDDKREVTVPDFGNVEVTITGRLDFNRL